MPQLLNIFAHMSQICRPIQKCEKMNLSQMNFFKFSCVLYNVYGRLFSTLPCV